MHSRGWSKKMLAHRAPASEVATYLDPIVCGLNPWQLLCVLKPTPGTIHQTTDDDTDERTLKYFEVTVKVKVPPFGPAKQKEPFLKKFNEFYDDWKAKAASDAP